MYADFLARLVFMFEGDQTVGKCEKRIVPPHSDIGPGMEMRAKLTNYDVAGTHELTAEFLHAPSLACAVAAISGTPACFFMSHNMPPYLSDIFHTHGRVGLPVSLSFPVILAAFVLEDHDFAQTALLDYGGLNLDAFHNGLANA